jgi:signal transduction histidine kinase
LLAGLGGWFLMRRALAPVARLTLAVQQVHTGHLRQQLPRTGSGDEMDRLTEVFNAMTVRLDDAFQQNREFTLNASHELKTPLAVMAGELETALREEALGPAEHERAVSQLEEVQRLMQIVEGLTFLAKADAGMLPIAPVPVPLHELVRDAATDTEMLGAIQRLKVRVGRCDEVMVQGDRRRLRQLLLILTDNAVKYNHLGGTVTLSLNKDDGTARLEVTNTGPGIEPELSGRVFDRFFRGDRSHSKDVEGCGLGLSIARWIVQAHGGQIRISSGVNQETTVSVALPVVSIRSAETRLPEAVPARS